MDKVHYGLNVKYRILEDQQNFLVVFYYANNTIDNFLNIS